MAIFSQRFYRLGKESVFQFIRYRDELTQVIERRQSQEEREKLLREELIEVTRHITDGIREILKRNRRLHDLVLNRGALPLATWTASLDKMAKESVSELKEKIERMRDDLEHCRIEGFPATMVLYSKPSFVTFEKFYEVIFELFEQQKKGRQK